MVYIPSWVLESPGDAAMLPGRRPSVRVPIAEKINFWRFATREDFYTCVTPPFYSYDPVALRVAQELDRDVRIVWRKQLWHPPNERTRTVQIVHVGIARYVPYTRNKIRLLPYVEMPNGSGEPAPNLIEFIFAGDPIEPGGPQEYQPFDMEAAKTLQEMFSGHKSPAQVDEEWYQYKIREQERAQRERARQLEASEEILKHADKALADLSPADEDDIKRLLADRKRKRREKNTGLSNPFVLLGR